MEHNPMVRVLCTALGNDRVRCALIELADGRFAITRAGQLLPARFGRGLLHAAVAELMSVSGITNDRRRARRPPARCPALPTRESIDGTAFDHTGESCAEFLSIIHASDVPSD